MRPDLPKSRKPSGAWLLVGSSPTTAWKSCEASVASHPEVGRRGRAPGGRFFLVERLWLRQPRDTERLHARAWRLLERHGVLGRESCAQEDLLGGFGAIYPILVALEESGKLRRGLFADGLGGAQFALPGAVDRLREARRRPLEPRALVLSSTDPALPWGASLAWPETSAIATKPKRMAGARVILVSGEPVFWCARNGKQVTTFPAAQDEKTLNLAAQALHERTAGSAGRRFRIQMIDGEKATTSAHARIFEDAGFGRDLGFLSAW